jgi:hypothetical protein
MSIKKNIIFIFIMFGLGNCSSIEQTRLVCKQTYNLNTEIPGKKINGFYGDFSFYSDVFKENGVRISPFISPGRAFFDFGPINVESVIVSFQWDDNGWFSAKKSLEIFDWKNNNWITIYTWNGNDKKIHEDSIPIYILPNYIGTDKRIRIGLRASGNAVIHLNYIIVKESK